MGVVVTYFDLDLVIKAFVITTGVFLALTVYTMQSKYDFSTWGARSVIATTHTHTHTIYTLYT